MTASHRVLITGANGYVGRLLLKTMTQRCEHVCGIDIHCHEAVDSVEQLDVRDPRIVQVLKRNQITHVVHLASIVQPGRFPDREYDIDVNGTRNVVEACLAAAVGHLTVTSSGAAYGYHADNPPWLTEADPLRGNDEFSYSRHKRLVEEMLADYRRDAPQLQQLILRPGAVLGTTPPNLITRLFSGRFIPGLSGVQSPFVFIWDQDLVDIIAYGVEHNRNGEFNVAGDGCLSLDEISDIVGIPVRRLPVWLMKLALTIARPLQLTPFGPEQVRFMQYRPVLSNARLKSDFGLAPRKTSREVLEFFAAQSAGSRS